MAHAIDSATLTEVPAARVGTSYKVDRDPGLLAPPVLDAAANARHFESIYRDAAGEVSRVPWADRRAHPLLVEWLSADAPCCVRPGARVAVVGCGLGDDVAELAVRGFDVLGFDVSPTAIAWAARRFPDLADRLVTADVTAPPANLVRRFDLVVEINTLQAVPPVLREPVAAGIASLTRPRGTVLAICRGRDESQPGAGAPPFPLTPSELSALMARHGFGAGHGVRRVPDDQCEGKIRLLASFQRM